MKIPSFLYGRLADVRVRCDDVAVRLAEGALLGDVAGEMLDTESMRGLILLAPPMAGADRQDHYLTYLFLEALGAQRAIASDDALRARILRSSLDNDWSLVCCLSPASGVPVSDLPAFLRALDRHWGSLTSVGKRFSGGMPYGQLLTELPTTIVPSLRAAGVEVPFDAIIRGAMDDFRPLVAEAARLGSAMA